MSALCVPSTQGGSAVPPTPSLRTGGAARGRSVLHGIKHYIRGVQTIINPLCPERSGTNLRFQRIPHFNGNKQISKRKQRYQLTSPTKIRDFSMLIFILDQAANLPINHTVKLSHKDNIISKMSMHRKKFKPFIPMFMTPVPCI